jgi:DNA-binding phage protein
MLADGRTLTQIASAAKVNRINLYQFKAGTRSLGFDSLYRIAEAVGLEITVQPKRRRSK